MLALLINFDDNSVSFADAVFPAEHPAKTIHINSIVKSIDKILRVSELFFIYILAKMVNPPSVLII